MSEWKNRVALVTGGSRGARKAIVLALAKAGAAVAVNYRERSEKAASVVNAIRSTSGRAIAFAADVSVTSAVQSMVAEVERGLGPIDILVNNAGTAVVRGLDDITEQDFDRAIAANLKSAEALTDAGRKVSGRSLSAHIERKCAEMSNRSLHLEHAAVSFLAN